MWRGDIPLPECVPSTFIPGLVSAPRLAGKGEGVNDQPAELREEDECVDAGGEEEGGDEDPRVDTAPFFVARAVCPSAFPLWVELDGTATSVPLVVVPFLL